jgi:succinylglutamate desuccinylase
MYVCVGNKLPKRDREEKRYVTSALNRVGGNEAESAAHQTIKAEKRLV